MRRQGITLLTSSLLAVALFFVGLRMPVPYVRLVPGPVTDTLGSTKSGPLITIKGTPTAQPSGKIYLVTVGEYGGPGKNLSAAEVLTGWWNKTDAVLPTNLLYPPSETSSQVQQQDTFAMQDSQQQAKVAALRYLGRPLTPGVDVAQVQSDSAATGKLKVEDVLVGVDGTSVPNVDALLALLKQHKVGDTITLHVNRSGQSLDVPVTLQPPRPGSSTPSIGIGVNDSYAIPFEIDIDLNDVGGPSAGMAFALGIIDKLTDGNLTGGKTVAGTGTIDADGNVGAIGGVQQKMAAARKAGAGVFLLPKANCGEAVPATPHGLRLVPVTTLSGAVSALKAIRAGAGDMPSCSTS
jgi:PDZ domain-containing protein